MTLDLRRLRTHSVCKAQVHIVIVLFVLSAVTARYERAYYTKCCAWVTCCAIHLVTFLMSKFCQSCESKWMDFSFIDKRGTSDAQRGSEVWQVGRVNEAKGAEKQRQSVQTAGRNRGSGASHDDGLAAEESKWSRQREEGGEGGGGGIKKTSMGLAFFG